MAGEPPLSVQLSIPASAKYLATARLVTADIASSIGMPIDVIEDLRVAVDEALTMLITGLDAVSDSTITCSFSTVGDAVRISVESSDPVVLVPPSEGGYAWIVLEAVSDEFEVIQLPAATRISFTRGFVARAGSAGHEGNGDLRS